MIEFNDITHYYGKRLIYEHLTFSVPEGRIMGLLGKNGTGKTTAINILNGFLKPQQGQCRILGHDVRQMPPEVRQRIGMLIEGHVQYSFMNVRQIERFYAPFYPRWNKDVYYQLISLLHIEEKQPLSHMSCGQRSQVALGLILAQDPDVLILDDFSLGLDPGYRRLFCEYLHDFAKRGSKTVFLTSHIVQDMERLVDDCIILDYGHIVTQMPVKQLLDTIRVYTFTTDKETHLTDAGLYHPSQLHDRVEFVSFLNENEVAARLAAQGVAYDHLEARQASLEDAFIGLTGKY